ncbi:Kinesin-like protein [Quillaja saponaria]|uniref:Kinesin-like protein n=1 Tax=Quillaja saponaria TaxID=32244 RepID=A0AAD7LSY2_QUISA|nr:Kinesin-like protein [Quillaja saponaria]
MWGPPSAMVEDPSPSSHQGIVPRIFQLLFSELQREQDNSEGKQFNYQCRCSFLEIYNEQIGDLLDPTQRNLEIRDDVKNGLYVENLTEEYVASCEDVTQILIKGLSSRKVGATSLNSKSSRSHIVFNFIIESWCKETSSKCFSSSKTSTVSLVDLAGLDRNKVDDAGRQCIREGRNVKKHLVDTLAKETQSGKAEEAPYRNSCLTNLLRESLGGNAKLSVICCISPDNKNNGESLRTLRFGQRVRSIKNEPVINEITENDVNDLSDQIRQLKEELIRAKSNVHNTIGSKSGYFQGRNVRDSLNQLRVSLNRSFLLPHIDNETEEEVNVDEDDVRKLRQQIDDLHSYCEENPRDISVSQDCSQISSAEGISEMGMIYSDEIQTEEECPAKTLNKPPHEDNAALADNLVGVPITSRAISSPFRNSISISSCCQSPILEGPLLSESPKIGNIQRKSMVISSSFLGSQNNVLESSKFKQSDHIPSSSQSNKILPGPTESLAASLQRGLQIIDYHQRNSASIKSSASFSFDHLMLTPYPEVDKANTLVQEKLGRTSLDGRPATFLCASCQQRVSCRDSPGLEDSLKARIVAEEAENPDHLTDTVPKNLENLVTKASKRETELENVCKEQAAKIEELNQLLLRNKILPIIEETCEIKEVQEELVQKASFDDVNEKEELLNEIQSLKSKLQLYNDACIQ